MPGTVLGFLHRLSTLRDHLFYYSHVTDEDTRLTEIKNFPRSHN